MQIPAGPTLRKRLGRPPIPPRFRRRKVSVSLPSKTILETLREARRRGVSLSEIVCEVLAAEIDRRFGTK